jgi:hypothetical protein
MEDSGAGTDAIVAKYSAVIIVHPTKLMAW